MAHWIKLPDGGYLNTDTLTAISSPRTLQVDPTPYRSHNAMGGTTGRLEGAAADALVAAIEAQMAAEKRQETAPRVAADDDFTEEEIEKMVSEFPHRIKPQGPPLSMEAAHLIRQGEERALKAVAAYLASTGVDKDGVHHFVGGIRWGLAGSTSTYEGPDTTLPDVEPLGSHDETPGIRQLDLRMGDDVLALRYGGVDYVAAIKIRFGGGVEGFSDRYLEVSAFNPHDQIWVLLARIDNPGKGGTRFNNPLVTIVNHDRSAFLGE